jgi:membrane protease YdiL (CAAX protease family)
MPEDEQIETHSEALSIPEPVAVDLPVDSPEVLEGKIRPRGIAPVWHTLVLVIGILAYSFWGAIGAKTGTTNPIAPSGAVHAAATGTDHVRIIRYALTGALELGIVVWIAFGLRLRKVPFRSLFGGWPKGLNDVTKEILIAAAFWVCSMIVLMVFAFSWLFVQNHIYQEQTAKQSATSSKSNAQAPKSPEQQQSEMVKQLSELAPANGIEIAAWGLLCLVVGFSEELIFRGYLQLQGIALLRNTPIAVILCAIVFGAGHGYQGVRGIFLISIFGALFGILTLMRKNLLPGMIAHSWHDFATGMALALIRSSHLLEHLPTRPK